MRVTLLTFLVLLGYVAVFSAAFLLVASIFTKWFSRFWRPCFYLCSLALVALLLLIPISGPKSDDFANNDVMFWPLVIVCLTLPFAAFKKHQRYIVLSAIIIRFSCVSFCFQVSRLDSPCTVDRILELPDILNLRQLPKNRLAGNCPTTSLAQPAIGAFAAFPSTFLASRRVLR